MKQQGKNFLIFTIFMLLLAITASYFSDKAAAATLSLVPADSRLSVSYSENIEVMLHTRGESINAFTAVISYPGNILMINQIIPESTFSITAEQKVANNTITITRGNISPVNGDIPVATLSVTSVSTGEAGMTFLKGSAGPNTKDN